MNLHHKLISTEPEFHSFKEAVQQAGLPHEDLNYQSQILIAFYNDDELVGTGGLEIINSYGLLRSVSVATNHRNQNIGKQITYHILKRAEESNVQEIYLLTETAKPYFQKLGFKEVHREAAPDEIKLTAEFAQVCPDSATCMVLTLNKQGVLTTCSRLTPAIKIKK